MSSGLLSYAISSDVLSSPPFVVVPGVINIRALRGTSAEGTQMHIKPLHVFRSGELTRITDVGRSKLQELGVTTVFDLRSDSEIAEFHSETPDIPGIRFVRAPALTENAWKMDIPELIQRYKDNELKADLNGYDRILQMAGPSYGLIFSHLRDHPSEPCLVHCTVGRDRTGLFVVLFYMLMGVSDSDIAHDYSLSTAGLAPFLPVLEARFRSIPVFRDNWEGFSKMFSAKAETMAAVLSMLREKFGGVEGYLKTHAGLTDEDMKTIRANMLVSS
ncbi:Tyrosine-protein phosphatase [Termitomyces sp. T112]|nr:Tyrosine-protein phosphatase [Termitomyces sp. T112]